MTPEAPKSVQGIQLNIDSDAREKMEALSKQLPPELEPYAIGKGTTTIPKGWINSVPNAELRCLVSFPGANQIGTCEEWQQGKIIFRDKSKTWVQLDSNIDLVDWHDNFAFKPIKTPEEIKKELVLKSVYAVMSETLEVRDYHEKTVEILYDLGLMKVKDETPQRSINCNEFAEIILRIGNDKLYKKLPVIKKIYNELVGKGVLNGELTDE